MSSGNVLPEFKVGDMVRRTSGGPKMTVLGVHPKQVFCQWLGIGELRQEYFVPDRLTKVLCPICREYPYNVFWVVLAADHLPQDLRLLETQGDETIVVCLDHFENHTGIQSAFHRVTREWASADPSLRTKLENQLRTAMQKQWLADLDAHNRRPTAWARLMNDDDA